MEKYCYVVCSNAMENEQSMETSKFGRNISAQYESTKFALCDVINTASKNDPKYEYVIFQIVDDNYLMDVITGKKYKRSQSSYVKTTELTFGASDYVPSSVVANHLRSLGRDGAIRHKIQMENFQKALIYGRQLYERRVYNESIQQQKDDDFIRNFRNNLGK